jgi:hypothetical protein
MDCRYILATRPQIQEVEMSGTSNYDLKSVKLPRLTGGGLSLMAGALEIGFLRGLLMPSMLKSGGITDFRALSPEESPTVFPLAFADKKAAPEEGPDPE